MRIIKLFLINMIMILISGCFVSKVSTVDNVEAVLQMKIADSLETAFAIHEAALRYAIVAKQYPYSSFYKKAVLKAAYLHCSPQNSTIDDSTSLEWFQVYASLPISQEEKEENAIIYISILKRIVMLQKEVESLTLSLKKQTQELTSRSAQIRELEAQIQKTKEELEKLKDIDVKVSKRGLKK